MVQIQQWWMLWVRFIYNIKTSDLAKALKLKGKQRTLNITNAISSSVSVTSKLVEFTISSNHHPEKFEVKMAWVVGALNLPSQSVSKAEIQRKWSHLRDVPIDIINKDVSIIIGADLPHLHICHNAISGDQNESVAMLTKLCRVLLGGNGNKSKVSLNHIRSCDY